MLRDLHSEGLSVVKVRGARGFSPLLPFEPPAIVRAALIESIKCYFTPK